MKTIMISGTGKGLGKELAKLYSKKNFNYFGLSKWDDLDIRNYKKITTYIENISKNDFPEILINNAGIINPETLLEMSLDKVKDCFDVNFFSLVNLTKIFVKKSIEYNLKTKIINIASTAGTGARPGRSIYAASKASVINFSFSMSAELKKYGIKVYCICPGAFNSDMRKKIEPDDDFENMLKPETIATEIFKIVQSDYLDNQILYIIG